VPALSISTYGVSGEGAFTGLAKHGFRMHVEEPGGILRADGELSNGMCRPERRWDVRADLAELAGPKILVKLRRVLCPVADWHCERRLDRPEGRQTAAAAWERGRLNFLWRFYLDRT